jgi:hypothetical protein
MVDVWWTMCDGRQLPDIRKYYFSFSSRCPLPTTFFETQSPVFQGKQPLTIAIEFAP